MEGFQDSSANDSYPIVELDSDNEFGAEDSSDDALDVILHGTPEQKRKLRRLSLGHDSSSEDEFEKEMTAELGATIEKMKTAIKSEALQKPNTSNDNAKEPTFYNQEYFDSDSDGDDANKTGKNQKHRVLSNDELLYDPDMDQQDEQWIAQQRNYLQSKSLNKPKQARLPKSDAVLNCPACMTLLCLDCQRHSVYKNQYRAMFVKNCAVNRKERLRCPIKKKRRKMNSKAPHNLKDLESIDTDGSDITVSESASTSETNNSSDEIYHPVKCTVCSTEVGVYDKDEVYHFFNILASY